MYMIHSCLTRLENEERKKLRIPVFISKHASSPYLIPPPPESVSLVRQMRWETKLFFLPLPFSPFLLLARRPKAEILRSQEEEEEEKSFSFSFCPKKSGQTASVSRGHRELFHLEGRGGEGDPEVYERASTDQGASFTKV